MPDVKNQRGYWGNFFELFSLEIKSQHFPEIGAWKVKPIRSTYCTAVRPPNPVIASQNGPPLAGRISLTF